MNGNIQFFCLQDTGHYLFQCILPGDLPIQPGIQRVETYINTVDTCSFQRPCLFLQQYAIRCQCHLLHAVQRFYLAYKLYTVLSYQWLATGNLEPGNTKADSCPAYSQNLLFWQKLFHSKVLYISRHTVAAM